MASGATGPTGVAPGATGFTGVASGATGFARLAPGARGLVGLAPGAGLAAAAGPTGEEVEVIVERWGCCGVIDEGSWS